MCVCAMCINMLNALCSFSFNCFHLLCFVIVVIAVFVIVPNATCSLCTNCVPAPAPTIHTIMLTLFIRCSFSLAHSLALTFSLSRLHNSSLSFSSRCCTATINIMNTVQTHAYIDFNYMFAHNRNDYMICIKNSHSSTV